MKAQKIRFKADILFLLLAGAYLMGCIATTHRTARTLYPGQVSFSGSYLQDRPAEDPFGSGSLQMVAADARAGIARGVDAGIMYSLDISRYNEFSYSTFWGDVKLQLLNKDNEIGKPILSTGLMKGYIHMEEIHTTGVPIMLSFPVSERLTPFLTYRHELFSESFFPETIADGRHTIFLGTEYAFRNPAEGRWTPRIGLGLGYLRWTLGGGGDLMFNVGITLDSPIKN